ncbi:MAG: hypothetical protein SFW65_03180 [Alphaproteobacteria bacterium]|nr:hypothetical protein [Alphaproteobacteria bacterium]
MKNFQSFFAAVGKGAIITGVVFTVGLFSVGLHAALDTKALIAPKGLGGPPASDIGLLKIQEGLQTVTDAINNVERRLEKLSGADTARDAQRDQLSMRLAEAMARDARAGAMQSANLAIGMANEAPKVAAAFELVGATGWSEADTNATGMWKKQTSEMGESLIPMGEDMTKEEVMEKVVAAGCEAGAMTQSEAKRAGCSSSGKYAGTFCNPAKWATVKNIETKPGSPGANAMLATVACVGTRYGQAMPTGDLLRNPARTSERTKKGLKQLAKYVELDPAYIEKVAYGTFIGEATRATQNFGAIGCVADGSASRTSRPDSDWGADYKACREILQQEGKTSPPEMSRDDVVKCREMVARRTMKDAAKQPGVNGGDILKLGVAANQASRGERDQLGSPQGSSNCQGDAAMQESISQIALYMQSPTFLARVKDGSFMKTRLAWREELKGINKQLEVQYANMIREYKLGTAYSLYAFNEPEPGPTTLAELFSDVGVDMKTLIPTKGDMRFSGMTALLSPEQIDSVAGAATQLALREALPTLGKSVDASNFITEPLLVSAK